MPRYLVETVSMFRMRYVVEADEMDHAKDAVVMNEIENEFGQLHVDESVFSCREVTDEEIKSLFIEDHPYLEGQEDRAFSYIHKISY